MHRLCSSTRRRCHGVTAAISLVKQLVPPPTAMISWRSFSSNYSRACGRSFSTRFKATTRRNFTSNSSGNKPSQSQPSSSPPPPPATSVVKSRSLPTRIWQSYSRQLQESPLFTKVWMAALIFFTSDSGIQVYEQQQQQRSAEEPDAPKAEDDASSDTDPLTPFSYDLPRALSGAAFGVVGTTWLHYWWNLLEHQVIPRLPLTTHLQRTVTKVVMDQGLGAPLYLLTYYFLTNVVSRSMHLLQQQQEQAPQEESGKTKDSAVSLDTTQPWMDIVEESWQHASNLLWPTLQQHWKLWPAVHMINFYFVPLHHRVLVQNVVLVGWSAYLSHLNHAYQDPAPDPEVAEQDDQVATTAQQP